MAIDTTSLRSRRALLAGLLGGLAALAAQALGRPAPTRAGHGDVHLGGDNYAETPTRITNTSAIGGGGVWGNSIDGTGVRGTSVFGAAIYGFSTSGTGVWGRSDAVTKVGVRGENASAGGTTIYGLKLNAGTAVWGDIQNPTSGSGAVLGTTNGTGPGVIGESALGRGGRFKGKKAQIRLVPSTAATHPSSGAAGDIVLDASKRLWLCKGGTTWVRLD